MTDLRELLGDPNRASEVSAEEATLALAELSALEAALTARLSSDGQKSTATVAAAPSSAAHTGPAWNPDDLLTVDEVAAMLQTSRQWVYRHAKNWPFTRKLSPKVLRFSRAGAARWLAAQRP